MGKKKNTLSRKKTKLVRMPLSVFEEVKLVSRKFDVPVTKGFDILHKLNKKQFTVKKGRGGSYVIKLLE